jgi:uncharacterized membrane protein
MSLCFHVVREKMANCSSSFFSYNHVVDIVFFFLWMVNVDSFFCLVLVLHRALDCYHTLF